MPAPAQRRDKLRRNGYVEVIRICISFLLGALAGGLLVACLKTAGRYGEYYSAILGGRDGPTLRSFLLYNGALLTMVFISGFIPRASVLSTMAAALKGAVSAFRICTYVRAFGPRGYLSALFAEFLSSYIMLFALIIMASQASDRRRIALRSGIVTKNNGSYFFWGTAALIITLCAGILHCKVMPILVYMALPS